MSHKYSSLPTGNTIHTITISIITITITLIVTVTIIYIGEYDEYGHNNHRGSNYNSNNGNYIEVSTN